MSVERIDCRQRQSIHVLKSGMGRAASAFHPPLHVTVQQHTLAAAKEYSYHYTVFSMFRRPAERLLCVTSVHAAQTARAMLIYFFVPLRLLLQVSAETREGGRVTLCCNVHMNPNIVELSASLAWCDVIDANMQVCSEARVSIVSTWMGGDVCDMPWPHTIHRC